METKIINLRGIDLIVSYTVSGKYYPATMYQPAEYPEAEIQSITLTDSNIDLFSFLENDYDTIYQQIEDEL